MSHATDAGHPDGHVVAWIPPDDAFMLEVERAAVERGMHIITDGCRVVVSPIVPPGWHRMGITHKSPPLAPEVPRCAA